ncbi:two component regulator with propeller domain [Sphingobacterium sp. JUb78]|nr:two component regulator with propeller domain [Sphingobacterium sp. JUb78]
MLLNGKITTMNSHKFHQLIISILILLYYTRPWSAVSQITNSNINQQISNSSVKSIFQDSQGYMWFGTFDGLNRYDGYEIKAYRNQLNQTNSLPHNYIYCIVEDQLKKLWIGTGQGVAIYDRNFDTFSLLSFLDFDNPEKKYIMNVDTKTIQVDKKNNVYIGTNGLGLLLKENNRDNAIRIPLKFDKERSVVDYSVPVIHIDKKNQIWVFISDRGLYRFDIQNQELQLINHDILEATSMTSNQTGDIFIANYHGVYIFHNASRKISKVFQKNLSSDQVNQLTLVNDDQLWVSTQDNGISIIDLKNDNVRYLNQSSLAPNALTSNAIYTTYVGKDNKKWIGTAKGGIHLIDDQQLNFQSQQDKSLQNNTNYPKFVRSFAQVDPSTLWIGTEGNGLYIWNRSTNLFRSIKKGDQNLTDNVINNILADRNGNIWSATDNGIVLYEQHGKSKTYTCIADNGLINSSVQILLEDAAGNIWATTFSNGYLYKYNPITDRFEQFNDSLIDLNCLTEDKSGSLWAGNYNTLIKINKQSQAFETYHIGKPVRSIYIDSKGRMWIGTEGRGLIEFDPNSKKIKVNYSQSNGLSNNSVLNILEDRKGNLWLSTFNGLSRFNTTTKSFTNYDQTDGLLNNEFSYSAAHKLSDGQLIFGGINGFDLFDPDKIQARKHIPSLALTTIKINNIKLNDSTHQVQLNDKHQISQITLPYGSSISIDYVALEFASPNKIKYRYMLEGWDKNWNDAGVSRSINYNNLYEGKYTLLINSTDTEGKWTKNIVPLTIRILPPWYRTWWSYLIYLSGIACAFYYYNRYRNKQTALQYQVEVSQLHVIKEREIYEKRQAFFTNISHEFRTPLTLIINPITDLLQSDENNRNSTTLQVVHRNAKRLLSLVDQLLIFRKAEEQGEKLHISQFNLHHFAEEIYFYFSAQAKLQHIDYQFSADRDDIIIQADKEKIEIVLCNLISNAFKFTPEHGQITFTINCHPKYIQILIKDSGIGIPDHIGDKIFEKFYSDNRNGTKKQTGFGIGMYLTRTFIAMHKGHISYQSSQDQGTVFELKLPLLNENYQRDHSSNPNSNYTSTLMETWISSPTETTNSSNKLHSVSPKVGLLVVDDDDQLRDYLVKLFENDYMVYHEANGIDALSTIKSKQPEVVISDVMMDGMNGIELCQAIKSNPLSSHIQVILLTNSASSSTKLEGIRFGADDYMSKPFDAAVLRARVNTLVKNRQHLQEFFFNAITLQSNTLKITDKDKDFIEKCIRIIEENLLEDLNVTSLSAKIGMSHSNLYKKIKAISGQTINEFIRSVRLKKAAEILINTDAKINEAADMAGFYDIKYFREQFKKLFGSNPSDYVKKYRKAFQNRYRMPD